jgi:hypothetical protein
MALAFPPRTISPKRVAAELETSRFLSEEHARARFFDRVTQSLRIVRQR